MTTAAVACPWQPSVTEVAVSGSSGSSVACGDRGQMLNFPLQKRNARTSSVADPKQDEGFKVVDRRLFTDQGELRKDVVEQERRDDEPAARKAASASQAAAQTDSRAPSKGVLAPDGSALTAQRETTE